jgi:hypothetical protein
LAEFACCAWPTELNGTDALLFTAVLSSATNEKVSVELSRPRSGKEENRLWAFERVAHFKTVSGD